MEMPERLVVIGGSAGALEALREIVGGLSASFRAPILVCMHLAEGATSRLPRILDAAGPLSARHPRHGDQLEPGTIFVAPPGRHLVVRDGAAHLSRGPKENRQRPAIDALFSSAARWYGPKVIGVVLSGALDDGAAGATAIAAQDGTVIVQDPNEAQVSAMPVAAARVVRRARITPVARMAALLEALATEELPGAQEAASSPLVTWESDNVDSTSETAPRPTPGNAVPLGCPDCHGGMFETDSPSGLPHYMCHVGHSWSPESLITAQRQASEDALYAAAAKLLEEATVLRRIAEARRSDGDTAAAEDVEAQADQAQNRARQLETMLRHSD
jgi:two-component system, chemotaxis family, protein-glutamate methylesterase/glutaminase